MRIIGVDPGYDRLGIAVAEQTHEKEKLLFSVCVETPRHAEYTNRLVYVGSKLAEVLEQYKPNALSVETLFMFKNKKTAMRVAEARGVILYEAGKAKIPVCEYTPLQIKETVTGFGRADKSQVAHMVSKILTVPADKDRHDDEYDAIAIALTGIYRHINTLSTKTNLPR